MTLPMWEALEDRRHAANRHRRFDAALITATLCNIHRAEDSDPISPFDFLPGFERSAEDAEKEKLRKSTKHAIALAFTQMRRLSPAGIQAEKQKMIGNLLASGVEDPEELIREVFPEL